FCPPCMPDFTTRSSAQRSCSEGGNPRPSETPDRVRPEFEIVGLSKRRRERSLCAHSLGFPARFAADSAPEGARFEPVWGLSCQVVVLVCCQFFVRGGKAVLRPVAWRSGSRSARKGSRDRNGSKAWRLAG